MSAPRTLLLFRSIHHVLAAEEALKAAGVPLDLVPVPKEISSACGMAVVVAPADRARALEALADTPPVRLVEDWKGGLDNQEPAGYNSLC
jgi:hypothetical protein